MTPDLHGADEDGLDGQPFADINVTLLVDVMLVLMVFMMMAFPLMAQGGPVDLPKQTKRTDRPVGKACSRVARARRAPVPAGRAARARGVGDAAQGRAGGRRGSGGLRAGEPGRGVRGCGGVGRRGRVRTGVAPHRTSNPNSIKVV